MKHKILIPPWLIITVTVLLVGVILVMGYRSFEATKQSAFDEFNQRQLVLASEANNGIEFFFDVLLVHMNALASNPNVKSLDAHTAQAAIASEFDEMQEFGVNDIGILDAQGILRYNVTAPDIIGMDFSFRQYYQEALKQTKADPHIVEFIDFKGVDAGKKGIILAIPIFRDSSNKNTIYQTEQFAGVIVCTFRLDIIVEKFIAPIRASPRGHTFLIDQEANVLWAPGRALFGKNFLTEAEAFPAMKAVVTKMMTGIPGTSKYSFHKFDAMNNKFLLEDTEKLLMSYMPINIGSKFWVLAVWAPQEDALKLLHSAYVSQGSLVGLIILIIFVGAFYALSMHPLINALLRKEVRIKTRKLRESQDRLQTVLDSLESYVFVTDLDNYEVLFTNKYANNVFGNMIGKPCWECFSTEQSGPCSSCVTYKLTSTDAKSFNSCIQSSKTGRWYDIHSRKIRWVDGRLVGLEIATDVTERKRNEEALKKLQHNLHLEKKKLEQVLSIDQKMSSITNLNKLVDFIINKATLILEAEKCSLMLLDQESNELLIRGAKGLDEEVITRTRIKVGEDIAGVVAQQGNPLLIRDIENNNSFSRENRSSYNSKSFMSVPIKVHNKLVGIVNVAEKKSKHGNIFTEVDLKILCTIVRQAAVAIENADYYRKLEYLSTTDSLTGLYNYRYFTASLDREISRAKRYSLPVSLIMTDIDDFKSYNDSFGHLEGDNLLKEISQVFRDNLRVVDIVCRYAGDEFVIIFPNTDIAQVRVVAQKLKDQVSNLDLKKKVSISIGLAMSTPNSDRRDLITRADQALYQAKKEGKDTIACLR